MNEIYEKIARNICSNKGQCVLILGPELAVDSNGNGFRSFYRDSIKNESSARFFGSENLFYFKDDYIRSKVQGQVLRFYENVGDQALMEMISRIPFPLIINVCPDKALNQVYQQKKIPFSEAYFTKESKAEFNNIPIPSKSNPVIYNIFGSVDLEQSLILTHNKLYETMEFLLPEKSMPDNIELFLKGTANSFIFLGFKFDSWQYQLVCHKLKIKTAVDLKTNVCTPYLEETEDVAIIMHSSFNMKSTKDNSFQCIHNIIDVCEKNHPQQMRPASVNGAYSTFVSYAWRNELKEGPAPADASNKGNEPNARPVDQPGSDNPEETRDYIVDLIESKFLEKDKNTLYQLFRDRKDLKYGDSIDSFMTRIGMGKTVVRVISHKYLTSAYCMVEALRISKHNDPEQRVFTIAMNDADFSNPQNYKDYWFEECKKKLNNATALDKDLYDDYVSVYRFIDKFMAEVKMVVNLNLNYADVIKDKETGKVSIVQAREKEFTDFMDLIFNKMNQSNA